MPVPILVYAGSAATSVAFEYGYHRLQGKRASTKQLFLAGALGSIPLGKVKILSKSGAKSVAHGRRLKKIGVGYGTQVKGAFLKMGSRDEVARHMRNTVPGFVIRFGKYTTKATLAHHTLSAAYDRTVKPRRRVKTKRYTPRG